MLSKEFERAAIAQSKALGFAPALVQVPPHPIQNRTADELKVIAKESLAEILHLIINNNT